jgi:ribosomal protein L37AE/L43A
MFKGLHTVSKGFEKSFNSVYHAKVRCPVCKEEIYANALMCPNCKTDFKRAPYTTRLAWQKKALKIVLAFSILIALAISLSEAPVLLGIIVGLVFYGLGYVIIQKIQSFINYHNK